MQFNQLKINRDEISYKKMFKFKFRNYNETIIFLVNLAICFTLKQLVAIKKLYLWLHFIGQKSVKSVGIFQNNFLPRISSFGINLRNNSSCHFHKTNYKLENVFAKFVAAKVTLISRFYHSCKILKMQRKYDNTMQKNHVQ